MTKQYKLNSTGSLWYDDDNNYYSYNQQMTAVYKGYRLFDSGFYSMTTRKHQADIKYYFNPQISLNYANFNYGVEFSINKELQGIDYELELLNKKRNTQKKKDTIKELITKKELLTRLLNIKVL